MVTACLNLFSSYPTCAGSPPRALHCQYNCCKKINWGSEYPVTADLSNVSDEGDWLPVTGSSIWWSSVPMGRGSAKDISEGFTSMDSDKGLFWFWMDSCSLKELSSAVESGGVSDPGRKKKKRRRHSTAPVQILPIWRDCQDKHLVSQRLPGQLWLQCARSCEYRASTAITFSAACSTTTKMDDAFWLDLHLSEYGR